MKRGLKKLVAFMLFLAMSIQLMTVPATVDVYASEIRDFSNDMYEITGYKGTDKDVVVPDDTGYTAISISYNAEIESLTIPEGFEDIYIFGCDNLKKVNIPSTANYLNISFCDSIESLDLSNVDTESSFMCISDNKSLKTITGPKSITRAYIDSNYALKTMDFSESVIDELEIVYCTKLENVSLNEVNSIKLKDLNGLKKLNIPRVTRYIELSGVPFESIEIKDNYHGFWIKDGGLYQDKYNYYKEEEFTALVAIDSNLETINVAEGTLVIQDLNLSGSYYRVKEINFPDSVEKLDYKALCGGNNIKKISLPKNLISLMAYSLSDINVDEIVIPESVKHIDDCVFYDYNGKVKLEKNTEYFSEYEGGIYHHYLDADGNREYSELVYFPKDKSSVKFIDDVRYIGSDVFRNSKIKELSIPNTVSYINLELQGTKDLTSIYIPESVYYISLPMLTFAPGIKNVTINPDNKYYTSYKNCIYNKDMTWLMDVPMNLDVIDIPQGVISLGYYDYEIIDDVYEYDVAQDDYVVVHSPIVYFPETLTEYSYFRCKKAYVYADSPIANYIELVNRNRKEDAEIFGYEPDLIDYELRDSNKDLLSMIYVVDEVSLKKGKSTKVTPELPIGLEAVTKLTKGNNTECKISYSIAKSGSKVAKVNSKTGKITGKKKGTCTLNVTCTINNGKKTTKKTFKVKVKVK